MEVFREISWSNLGEGYLVEWGIIERMWSDVGEANEEARSAVYIWVLLNGPHWVQQVTFVIYNMKKIVLK